MGLNRRQFLGAASLALPALLHTHTAYAQNNVAEPLMISEMRKRSYPGSDIVIEQTLKPAGNYNRYVASYRSETTITI
jgi:hypothetical protein